MAPGSFGIGVLEKWYGGNTRKWFLRQCHIPCTLDPSDAQGGLEMGLTPTERTAVRRHPERGRYDRGIVYAILDEALICHVGFVVDGQPFVIPTIHARLDDDVYLHGSAASRMLTTLGTGIPACLTVTLLDGLVLARSAFSHSMNYRSVVVLGRATEVAEEAEKMTALEALVEHAVPGRWNDARHPTQSELRATSVLKMPLAEASAKIRSGPPKDSDPDLALPVWAGVIPLEMHARPPIADPHLPGDRPAPPYVRTYGGRHA
jgi:nitroimidazol reductase NimA-like FMN-containing flavoprotein (pyridoxamine 5'-phosphate oxidase superfamily)